MSDSTTTPQEFSVTSALDTPLEPWEPELGDGATVLDGEMKMEWRVLFVSPDGRQAAGVWATIPHRARLVHPFHESYVVLAGKVTATPEGGEPRELGPGDAIVLPKGTVWEVEFHEPTRKYWTIYDEEGLGLDD
jgi:uncharacterized cupin superfamily protein